MAKTGRRSLRSNSAVMRYVLLNLGPGLALEEEFLFA
jgi:hypothetical protein